MHHSRLPHTFAAERYVSLRSIAGLMAVTMLGIGAVAPVGAQRASQADTIETTPPGAARAAVVAVRKLYFADKYSAAVAKADSALRQGLGSTELQAWRLASLARTGGPDSVMRAMIPARKMTAMHPRSPWAPFGLALASIERSDSVRAALAASEQAVVLAPNDQFVRWMRARVLMRAAKPREALDMLDSLPAQLRDTPLLMHERANALQLLAGTSPSAQALRDSAARIRTRIQGRPVP